MPRRANTRLIIGLVLRAKNLLVEKHLREGFPGNHLAAINKMRGRMMAVSVNGFGNTLGGVRGHSPFGGLKRSAAGVALGLAVFIASLAVLPAWAAAEPVLVLLTGAGPDGAGRFAGDLEQIWARRTALSNHVLSVRTRDYPEARLRDLSRGRADFAIVDIETAVSKMPRYGRVSAVAILWPILLHPLTRESGLKEISLPLTQKTWVLKSGEYAYLDISRNMVKAGQNPQKLLSLVPYEMLTETLADGQGLSLLIPAPYPTHEISRAIESGWRLTPLAGRLLDSMHKSSNWLFTANLPANTYPGQTRPIELPAAYMVLVGRTSLDNDLVEKMLDSIYRRTSAKAVVNPLFDGIDDRMNAVFAKILPFHPHTAKSYGLNQNMITNQ